MRKKPGKKIEHIVEGLLNRWETSKVGKGNDVREAWGEAAGEETKGHTQPISFKKGILLIAVENSTWLYKLTLEKRKITEKFNDVYKGKQKVQDIRFRVGTIEYNR